MRNLLIVISVFALLSFAKFGQNNSSANPFAKVSSHQVKK